MSRAGVAAEGTGAAFAAAVQELLSRPEDERRKTARARAEQFSWSASVEIFLRLHDAPVRSFARLSPGARPRRSGAPPRLAAWRDLMGGNPTSSGR
ncbi:MAG TPA: hypothetical protein VHN18_06015 [Micromonosporaceae bacterium]|nr:hypothetical protein [Micromonosporaceae bacterium]